MGNALVEWLGSRWAPGFAGWALPLAWAGIVAVFALGLISSFWSTASSAGAEGETGVFSRIQASPGWRVWDAFVSLLAWSVPALLFVGVLLTVFPLGERSTLLLASRARGGRLVVDDGGAAQAAWRDFAKADADGRQLRLIDVGPIVDDVLKRAAAELEPPLLADDAGMKSRLAGFAVEAVRARRPEDLNSRACI